MLATRKARRADGATHRRIASEIALAQLKAMASMIKPADFPGLAAKIRSAIKSAGGAVRNARRMEAKGGK